MQTEYERYIQALQTDLKEFRHLYQLSIEEFQSRSVEVKKCQNLSPFGSPAKPRKRACLLPSPLRQGKNHASKEKILHKENLDPFSACELPAHDGLVITTTPALRVEVSFVLYSQ